MATWQRWKGIMKCYPFEEKRLAKWQPPYIVQPKYDGFRCRAVPTQTGTLLLSSEENVFFSVPHLNEMFDNLKISQELDGELYCHGMSFDQLSSILLRTVNLHPDYKEVEFHCFDVINNDTQPLRLKYIDDLKGLNPKLIISPFWVCDHLGDIMQVYDKIIALGYEGIIIRHLNNIYEYKRSTFVMKFKPKKLDIYEIIDCQEEVSIDYVPKGTLGSLVCRSGDGNLFAVGTGFSADQRRELWKVRHSLGGKFAKIGYQHLTSGKQVPRFPVFVNILEKENNHA